MPSLCSAFAIVLVNAVSVPRHDRYVVMGKARLWSKTGIPWNPARGHVRHDSFVASPLLPPPALQSEITEQDRCQQERDHLRGDRRAFAERAPGYRALEVSRPP